MTHTYILSSSTQLWNTVFFSNSNGAFLKMFIAGFPWLLISKQTYIVDMPAGVYRRLRMITEEWVQLKCAIQHIDFIGRLFSCTSVIDINPKGISHEPRKYRLRRRVMEICRRVRSGQGVFRFSDHLQRIMDDPNSVGQWVA